MGPKQGQYWVVVPCKSIPEGTRVLNAVWALCRKRRIHMYKVYKYKACLNIHGGHQEHGVN